MTKSNGLVLQFEVFIIMKMSKKINIRITEQQLKNLLIESIKTDKSKSTLIREMLDNNKSFSRKHITDEKSL